MALVKVELNCKCLICGREFKRTVLCEAHDKPIGNPIWTTCEGCIPRRERKRNREIEKLKESVGIVF